MAEVGRVKLFKAILFEEVGCSEVRVVGLSGRDIKHGCILWDISLRTDGVESADELIELF